ncbi:hypothetical protein BASA50_001380 [Batrachochytrium salamandrivorans]|uniref:Uncharacterized protein n=1 Tax=Batrachochytrium salamandrivorans TaxID=1357716 RepID=A0ABQ8EVZ8_9FUNG|nr:hypothetical protein BASA62_010374 [Batrachochytrium salamandrivorans]KAH6567061.1 hypothetical protein BASA60_009189 [Batrachochytrium salamandrivorans]KAH6587247.1 hypothetical protein BASA50_001380 [Batrachochytrium salamandrivorans]
MADVRYLLKQKLTKRKMDSLQADTKTDTTTDLQSNSGPRPLKETHKHKRPAASVIPSNPPESSQCPVVAVIHPPKQSNVEALKDPTAQDTQADDIEAELLQLERELQLEAQQELQNSGQHSSHTLVSTAVIEKAPVYVSENGLDEPLDLNLDSNPDPNADADLTFDPSAELQSEHQLIQERLQRLRDMQMRLPSTTSASNSVIVMQPSYKRLNAGRSKKPRKIRHVYQDEENM